MVQITDASVTSAVDRSGEIPARSAVYFLVSAALLLGAGALSSSSWVSDGQLHTLLEVSACLLAFFAAAMAFVRFYSKPSNSFLFVATAFLGTGFLDGYHAVVTSSYFADLFPSGVEPLVAWSWLASRMYLSVFLWLAYLAWVREARLGPAGELPHGLIYAGSVALTLASFAFFVLVPVPQGYFPELASHRPQDFLPAIFFLLALVGFLRKQRWRRDPFEHCLVLSLIVGVIGQAAYMAWAARSYDAMFDAAHFLKNVSYLLVLVGLVIEMFHVYRRDQKSLAAVRSAVDQLEQEVGERRRAETERAELEEQLRQAQKLEAVGQLAGGIAHDFNNLLTAIKGYTQLGLKKTDPDIPLATDLQRVLECSDRGARLVQQLVAFSRRQELEHLVFDVNELVERASHLIERLVSEDIELVIEPGADPGSIHADPHQIEQVIINLAVNARDAMPGGGTLTIATASIELDEATGRRRGQLGAGSYVELSVTDTGTGMDAPTRERVFEPFFTTKEVGKGTGLGLATAYGIVKQHHGAIFVDSEPGAGTVFHIYLPGVEGDADLAPLGAKLGEPGAPGKETILLVEDEDMVRDVTLRYLEQQGYTVLTAARPDDAVLLYEEHEAAIDLLLTDVVMPGFNGRELYFRLARRNPDLKVLFMSGYPDESMSGEDDTMGARFIEKPFAPNDLLGRVRDLLDG